MVRDLRRARSEITGFPKTLLFFQGDVAQGARFFRDRWPEAHAVADEKGEFFEGFGCRRATFGQLFGLRALGAGWQSGQWPPCSPPSPVHRCSRLLRGERVVWAHEFDHAGDHPDWTEVARQRDPACEPA